MGRPFCELDTGRRGRPALDETAGLDQRTPSPFPLPQWGRGLYRVGEAGAEPYPELGEGDAWLPNGIGVIHLVSCEHKGTTAQGSRAADPLCKNLDIPVEACGARMPEVSSSVMTRSMPCVHDDLSVGRSTRMIVRIYTGHDGLL